jgi:hypothetical protein
MMNDLVSMKASYLIVALICVVAFSFSVRAQYCGGYSVKVFVHDSDLEPVKNLALKLTPLGKDELDGAKFEPATYSAGVYELKLRENGILLKEKYKLEVSARGFGSVEKVITFPYCQDLVHYILMLGPGQARAVVSGKVADEDGELISYARMIFTAADKTQQTVNADIDGNYEIRLKPGDHTVKIYSVGSIFLLQQNVTVPPSGVVVLDPKIKGKEKLTEVTGSIYDPLGAVILDAEIAFFNREGKAIKAKPNANGQYSVMLPAGGPYSVQVVGWGFEKFTVERYFVPFLRKGQMTLDIMLGVARPSGPVEVIVPKNDKLLI